MSLRSRWIANCDERGCREEIELPVFGDAPIEVAVFQLGDAEWQTLPGLKLVHCPDHWTAPR